MKQMVIFDSEPGDFIHRNIDKLIKIRKTSDDDLFLRFNGCTIRVEMDDTADTVYKKYEDALHMISLWSAEKNGYIDWESIKQQALEDARNGRIG